MINYSKITKRVNDFCLIYERAKDLDLVTFTAEDIKPTISKRKKPYKWYAREIEDRTIDLANGSTLSMFVNDGALEVVGKREVEVDLGTQEKIRGYRTIMVKETMIATVNIYKPLVTPKQYVTLLYKKLTEQLLICLNQGLE